MTMSAQQVPLLNLRMRSTRSCPVDGDNDDVVDRVAVMLQQDSATYACRDYILRRKLETEDDRRASPDCPSPSEVDTLCREKMCEWSYRVVDHFHAPREVVSISISYLDRFIDQCACDRTAFKLAAMTSLYVATKLFNNREISMTSLAELSRGEFDVAHIADMESIILQTLSWRMHPPTVQCFINHFQALLPFSKGPVTKAIYQRAAFFAELSVFDYCCVTQPRSLIALAAILNSIEGMDSSIASKDDQDTFVSALLSTFDLNHSPEDIEATRNRLWYIYSQSAQYLEDDILPLHAEKTQVNELVIQKDPSEGELSQSPVSVSLVDRC